MARFDVDASATTYHPSGLEWVEPQLLRNGDGSFTESIYQDCRLYFEADGGGEVPPAAYEEWRAFDDGAAHSIILPSPDDVLGSDITYTSVYIKVSRTRYTGVNVEPFSVTVLSADITTT